MSTKDNSNKKQNKGFIALLVEKARNIFDTEESKTENTKKATKATSKPKSTSAKSSKAGKHSLTKSTTDSKSGSKTTSTSKTKTTSKKATTAKATTTKVAAAKTTKTKADAKTKAEDEEKINKTSLSVEEKDKEKNKVIEKITVKEDEKEKAKTQSKTKAKSPSKAKAIVKDNDDDKDKEKTDSENNENRVKILEYYDLPFRYNHTVVKVLAQTPNRLFIYWDVSDEDKQALIDKFGPYFYNNTKPVLIVHNKTMNYSFEVDINDYANSWYLHVNDSKCDYDVELGRRSINKYAQTPNGYVGISQSNSIQSPNDHILFDELGNSVVFENVKTSEKYEKDISSAEFLKRLGDLLNIKGLYDHLYKGEVINSNFDLNNPTS